MDDDQLKRMMLALEPMRAGTTPLRVGSQSVGDPTFDAVSQALKVLRDSTASNPAQHGAVKQWLGRQLLGRLDSDGSGDVPRPQKKKGAFDALQQTGLANTDVGGMPGFEAFK